MKIKKEVISETYNVQIGDIVTIGEEIYLISNVGGAGKHISLYNLNGFTRYNIFDSLEDVNVALKTQQEEYKDVQVFSEKEYQIQMVRV